MQFFGGRRKEEDTPKDAEVTDTGEAPELPVDIGPKSGVGFDTVIGAASTVDGSLRCEGNIRLDGQFTGTLEITGNVLVGETARITADIDARNISIAGVVEGNITGHRVQILGTGRIYGDIKASTLTTDEGAFIDGNISMKREEIAQPMESANPEEPEPEALEMAADDEVIDAEIASEDEDEVEDETEQMQEDDD
jgi:cytoskeletal protein CcmA (bactofilin family)